MTHIDRREQDLTPLQSETQPVSESLENHHDLPLAPDLVSPEQSEISEVSPANQQEILDFWFGPADQLESSYDERRRVWFGKDEAVDQDIRDRFSSIYQQIVEGNCKDWQTSPEGCLALILVLDQFTRNMFRGQPQAFETDPQALKITQRALALGLDRELAPVQRLFLYLPLEHSENRDHQQQAVTLFQALADEHQEFNDTYVYALKHQAVIERFGRFPHRNEILGRPSTPEELEFLQQPGSSF